ncbi:MAG: LacI family DNA-binding transcriptional regulator, partial [Geminicoccaceae bacterium]
MTGRGRRDGTRSPTLRDVATLAEVSLMTVSNVVNGRVGRVGEVTRRRIEAAIAALGYRTQQRGRSLKLAREFAVGLAVVHPDRRFLDDPFISYVASGMSNALADAGYGLVVNGIPDVGEVDRLLRHAMHIDALAIIASGPRLRRRAAYRRLTALPHPLVVIEDEPQRGLGDTCTVLQ